LVKTRLKALKEVVDHAPPLIPAHLASAAGFSLNAVGCKSSILTRCAWLQLPFGICLAPKDPSGHPTRPKASVARVELVQELGGILAVVIRDAFARYRFS
jgi:hypothetical protein